MKNKSTVCRWGAAAVAITVLLLFVGSAYALPTGADYFTATGMSLTLYEEKASYESDLFVFNMADPTDRYMIFTYDQEPNGFLTTQVITDDLWAPLATGFGFGVGVHTQGSNDPTPDYYWFTDTSLNQKVDGTSVDTTIEHIMTDFVTKNFFTIYVDDQLGGGDQDFNDMTTFGFSCDIQPVPEPATMLLFGTGLAGLVGMRRQRSKK